MKNITSEIDVLVAYEDIQEEVKRYGDSGLSVSFTLDEIVVAHGHMSRRFSTTGETMSYVFGWMDRDSRE